MAVMAVMAVVALQTEAATAGPRCKINRVVFCLPGFPFLFFPPTRSLLAAATLLPSYLVLLPSPSLTQVALSAHRKAHPKKKTRPTSPYQAVKMKSFLSLLPLAAFGLCAPQPVAQQEAVQTITSYGPVQTVTQTWATTTTWNTAETHISKPVPTKAQDVIDLLVELQVDIHIRLQGLNEEIAVQVDLDVDGVVKLVEGVLQEVILLVEDVVAILGKVVFGLIVFVDAEVTLIVQILVAIIADILWTVAAIINDFNLGNLLAEILGLVAQVLVLLLKVVAGLVDGLLLLVLNLLRDLGVWGLVQGLLGLVFELLVVLL